MRKFVFQLNKRLTLSYFRLFSNSSSAKISKNQTIFVDTQNENANEELKLDPIATSLEEYKKAMESFHLEKYSQSEELFKRTLNILKNSNQSNSETSIHILKKFF